MLRYVYSLALVLHGRIRVHVGARALPRGGARRDRLARDDAGRRSGAELAAHFGRDEMVEVHGDQLAQLFLLLGQQIVLAPARTSECTRRDGRWRWCWPDGGGSGDGSGSGSARTSARR